MQLVKVTVLMPEHTLSSIHAVLFPIESPAIVWFEFVTIGFDCKLCELVLAMSKSTLGVETALG